MLLGFPVDQESYILLRKGFVRLLLLSNKSPCVLELAQMVLLMGAVKSATLPRVLLLDWMVVFIFCLYA